MPQGERLLRHRVDLRQEISMPTRALDPESLAVETFATTPAIAVPTADEAAASRTSCPGPPYCTC
jgi:hypothetical protein